MFVSRIVRSLAAAAAISALAISTLVAPASAMQLFPTSHYVWKEVSVAAWNSGDNPQAFAGAQPMVATNYLTVTVRTGKVGDRIAYRLTYNGQTFDRYVGAGQTSGLRLKSVAASEVGISLLSPGSFTTQSAQNVSLSVCTGAHASCPIG